MKNLILKICEIIKQKLNVCTWRFLPRNIFCKKIPFVNNRIKGKIKTLRTKVLQSVSESALIAPSFGGNKKGLRHVQFCIDITGVNRKC